MTVYTGKLYTYRRAFDSELRFVDEVFNARVRRPGFADVNEIRSVVRRLPCISVLDLFRIRIDCDHLTWDPITGFILKL